MVTVYYKRITMILLCSERIAKFPIQNTRNAIQLRGNTRGNTCLKLSFSPSLVLKKTIIYFTLDLPSIMVALYKFIFTCNNHKAAK